MKKNSNSSATRKRRSTSSRKSSSAGVPFIPKLDIAKDLREFVGLCVSTGVEFVIVGGYALAFHGAPRFTQDIDLFIATSAENAAKIEVILRDFGVSARDVAREDLLTPNQVIQVGRPPNRVDILTSIDGVTWQEAWQSRIPIELSGIKCFAIGRESLIKNKRASGRPQDVADVIKLENG